MHYHPASIINNSIVVIIINNKTMEAILIALIVLTVLIAWQRAILAGELVSRAFALDPTTHREQRHTYQSSHSPPSPTNTLPLSLPSVGTYQSNSR